MEQFEEEELKSRPYQAQLEEIATAKNTIIHLPTGSGKTFIAVRLINKFRKALQKPWKQGGKRTFFLVNTVPLVNQQKKVIKRMCAVKQVAGYSGEDGVDVWDLTKWDAELSQNWVIVMTCQILSDMLTHNFIKISDINLLIFDECHHAVDDHPMRMVMKHFEGFPYHEQPRVLGLTATLLNSNVKIGRVEQTLRDLETTFHATIATVNELGDVLSYSTNPRETVITHRSLKKTSAAEEAIKVLFQLQLYISAVKLPRITGEPNIKLELWQRDISTDPDKIVKEVKNIISSMMTFINELGVYGGALGILAYIILLERLKRKAVSTEEEKLYKFTVTHSIIARKILLDSMQKDTGYQKILNNSSDKVKQLLNILKEYNPEVYTRPGARLRVNFAQQPLSGIIFTQQRFTAKVIYNLLKDVITVNPEEFSFLKHDFIVGFNVNPMKCTREQHYTKKTSQTALLKFRNKELNCLISTSVIEEGVDVPQCLLVLRYDPPLEYRSYIQSKGRARSSDSSYVILINESDQSKFMAQYRTFQQTEKYIQSILVGSTDDRSAPTEEDIEDGLYQEDVIPPYITPHGARLSAVQAISLLNRYCSMLPHDQFTLITPMWIEETIKDPSQPKEGTLRVIKIYMPLACPIREAIGGMPMHQQKAAKRSASLNACIKLHEIGELDYFTLLPKNYGTVEFEQPDVKACFPNWPWDEPDNSSKDSPKPGTKKRVRKYPKVFPSLTEAPKNMSSNQNFHLHIIKLNTAFEAPTESREKALYELLQKHEGYGLLTVNALPKICDFPMYLTVGEVTTSLSMNYAVIQLDKRLFELIKNFHFFIFDQVLEVAKKFTVFDGTANSLYVVPILSEGDDGFNINWRLMQNHRSIPPVAHPTYEERKAIKNVTVEQYLHHVVTPWYRSTILPARYIVSKVLEYKTPQSEFDTDGSTYGTYADYYSSKYNLDIYGDKSQPLLEVRDISTRMNCLLPRAATLNKFTDKQLKTISLAQGDDRPKKGFPEIFIPEFCVRYDFPGVYWYKAVMLPSIIHRVTSLLVAYELRAEIAKAVRIGLPHLKQGQEWLPIQLNQAVTVQSLLSMVEEPPPVNTIDRINNPIDDEAPRPNKIISMKESLYELQKKKINEQYDWDERMEPMDIERNVSTVTVMDIECYDEFVSARMKANVGLGSPSRDAPSTSAGTSETAAILAPPIPTVSEIALLSKKPSVLGPELRDILAALTTINSHDTFNLERAETLGDSFLKFAASLYLYHKFPSLNEGQLTNIKCRFIGNRNLYYAGVKAKLGGRMKVEQFGPKKDFLVPGFFAPKTLQTIISNKKLRPTCLIGLYFSSEEALSGQLSEENKAMIHSRYVEETDGHLEREPDGGAQTSMQIYVGAQAVSDKCIADCVEALVGTYLLNDGVLGAVKVLEWFKIMPEQDNFSKMLTMSVPTALSEKRTTAEEINRLMNHSLEEVEQILDYKFQDPSFLLEALSHPSHIRNRYTRSYERLEFLGDAILDFLITSYVFENSPDLKPGELTDLRSALVNNVTFASYVVKLGLHKFICYQLNPVLENAIMRFIEHQERRDHQIIEDMLYLIDEEDCQISEYVEVPKVLSDVFESLAGAIFLDSGGQLARVWTVFYRLMRTEIHEFSRRIPRQPVRLLYEMIHACPHIDKPVMLPDAIPKVMVRVTVTKNGRQRSVHGFGSNKFQAKRAAAKLALKVLAA